MRRRFVVPLLLVVAAAVVLAVTFGSSGGSGKAAADSHAATPAIKHAAANVIPTTNRHAQVVEPVAGETADSSPMAVAEPTSTAHPTAAASVTPASDAKDESVAAGEDAVTKADVLKNGIALPPIEAPQPVHDIIEAGNSIARTPYLWGGGHGKWLDTGYDCSGSVSYALASAGLLNAPLDSGRLMSWGAPGPGKWVTIYASPVHVYLVVAGVRFDTSGTKTTGSRWQGSMRNNDGFVQRHPPGL